MEVVMNGDAEANSLLHRVLALVELQRRKEAKDPTLTQSDLDKLTRQIPVEEYKPIIDQIRQTRRTAENVKTKTTKTKTSQPIDIREFLTEEIDVQRDKEEDERIMKAFDQ